MERLIEEIIAKETEIAQEYQKVIDTHMVSEDMSLEEMYCDDTEVIEENLKRCKELLDYHNTIANTMRKYQKIEQIPSKRPDEMIQSNPTQNAIRKVLEDEQVFSEEDIVCVHHGLYQGDTLYQETSWDGGIGFDYIRNIKYCPICGKELPKDD